MRRCSRQCIRKTDPPLEGYPLWTGGSGFVVHIAGRTCFFTTKHIFANSDGQIDQDQLRRIIVVKEWGDPRGRNLSFEETYFPRIPEHAGSAQILDDVLLLSCHQKVENQTDDGFIVFDDFRESADPAYLSSHPLWIYGFPNVAGTPPIDYDNGVYRPNRVEVKARFDHLDNQGYVGVGQVLRAANDAGEQFSMMTPPDGMSGSVVLEDDPFDGTLCWAGMLIQASNNTVRFITARFLSEFAKRVVCEERAAGKWQPPSHHD